MPSEQPLDDTEFCPARSWRTRMASVMRQFERLVQEPVMRDDLPVDVIGIQCWNGKTRLTVSPVHDHKDVFSTDLEEVSP